MCDSVATLKRMRDKYFGGKEPCLQPSFGYALVTGNRQISANELPIFRYNQRNGKNKTARCSPVKMVKVERTDPLIKMLDY